MEKPLVSICIPAFRADRYLAETLDSVARQTYAHWEIIVTEDGSRDDTENIVRRFSHTVYQPCTYNRHAANRGLPTTRNTGIRTARGSWIAFLDADDVWRPNHLEALVDAVSTRVGDLVFSGTDCFVDSPDQVVGQCVPTAADLENLPVALYTGRLSVLPSSVLVRRDAFDRYGLISVEYPHVNDTEYWLRVLRLGGRVLYSGQVTCLYRKHAQSMSRRIAELLADSAQLCERYADWTAIPRALRRARPASLYRWAARNFLPEDPATAYRILSHALRLQPLNPKTLGLWARSGLRAWRTPELQRRAA